MTPQRCATILAKRLGEQIMRCRRLLELSRLQQTFLAAEDYLRLERATRERQEILRKIMLVDRVIACYRNYWRKTASEGVSENSWREVETLFISLGRIMDELLCSDESVREQACEHAGRLREEIGRLQQGKVIVKAYRPPRLMSQPQIISKVSM